MLTSGAHATNLDQHQFHLLLCDWALLADLLVQKFEPSKEMRRLDLLPIQALGNAMVKIGRFAHQSI